MFITGQIWNRADTEPAFAVGTIGLGHDGKMYKYLRYEAATAAVAGVAGEVAAYLKTSTTVVTSHYSDTDNVGAGVLQASLADGEYGWLQIRGPATLSIALTAGADGNSLTTIGAGDGTLDVTIDSADAGIVPNVCAYAIDADVKIIMCDFPF